LILFVVSYRSLPNVPIPIRAEFPKRDQRPLLKEFPTLKKSALLQVHNDKKGINKCENRPEFPLANGILQNLFPLHLAAAIPFFSASTAALMAWNICVYPVQRHRFPLSAWRMSSSLGSGLRSSSAFTVMMKPGV